MDAISVLLALAMLGLGVLLGVWLSRYAHRQRAHAEQAHHLAELERLRGEAERSRAELERTRGDQLRAQLATSAVDQQLAEAKREVAEAKREVAEARQQAADARAAQAAAMANLAAEEAQRKAAQDRAAQAVNDREAMLNQFKVLSSETLERHGQAADQAAEQRLRATEQLMKPVAEALAEMRQRIGEVEKSREAGSAELKEQVRTMLAANEILRRETHSLSTALRAPQIRGTWGEQSLRRIVEISGLVERCDFFEQASTRTEDGLFRPDLTIRLAGDKVVFVDSKVPLTALLDAYGTEDEASRAEHLGRFGRAVRGHIDNLSKKNYWALDAGSPEFVVLFLPSEEIFRAALEQQPDLQEYASSRQIVLASPSIVIALLKTVAHGWQQARLAESAEEVQRLGRELYERLGKLGSHFDGLGRALTNAVKAYNGAVGSLESRVLVAARRLSAHEVAAPPLKRLSGIDAPVREIVVAELIDGMGDDRDPGAPHPNEAPTEAPIGVRARSVLNRPVPEHRTLPEQEPPCP